jgi:hypothetical protein
MKTFRNSHASATAPQAALPKAKLLNARGWMIRGGLVSRRDKLPVATGELIFIYETH